MTTLVTAADGMLGTDFSRYLERAGHQVVRAGRAMLDVTDLTGVRRTVREYRPTLVVHTAALTDVDRCEREPDEAYRVNAVGTWNIALACAESGAELVYVSTCGVFDGTKAIPYTEADSPRPLTHYHRSKFEGERIVAAVLSRHYILRPGWLFGGAASHRRNFVANRYREASGKASISSAADRFGSPTYTFDFAAAAMRLVTEKAYGLYHIANAGSGSRYDYVAACMAALGLPTRVDPVVSDAFPRSAPVPASEALDCMYYRLRGLPPLRPWKEALNDYVRGLLLPDLINPSKGQV